MSLYRVFIIFKCIKIKIKAHYLNGDTMKRLIIILAIIMAPFIINKNIKQDIIEIPNESIRIRVIANSNSLNDQYEKLLVTENIQLYVQELLKNATTKEQSEDIIKKNIINIEEKVKETLNQLVSSTSYQVKYGNNYFPEKDYKGITYKSGYYESLVITLGKGEGNNWWCVLFPPLCLMETEENSISEIEYKLYITEILSKYK